MHQCWWCFERACAYAPRSARRATRSLRVDGSRLEVPRTKPTSRGSLGGSEAAAGKSAKRRSARGKGAPGQESQQQKRLRSVACGERSDLGIANRAPDSRNGSISAERRKERSSRSTRSSSAMNIEGDHQQRARPSGPSRQQVAAQETGLCPGETGLGLSLAGPSRSQASPRGRASGAEEETRYLAPGSTQAVSDQQERSLPARWDRGSTELKQTSSSASKSKQRKPTKPHSCLGDGVHSHRTRPRGNPHPTN